MDKQQEQHIDLADFIARYRRYWWLFALSLVVCFLLAALYLKVKKPVYSVVSTVLVDQDDDSKSAKGALLKSLSLGGGSKVDDEIIVMGSQQLRMLMVKKLGLNRTYVERKGFLKHENHYNDSPIEISAPESIFDTLSTSLQFKIKINAAGQASVRVKQGRWRTLAHAENVTLPANVATPYGIFNVHTTRFYQKGKTYTINSNVTVGLLRKKANAIDVNVMETNVQRGRDMLNTLIALYNERGQREKDEQALNTAKFIDERLELVYKNLTGSEAEIEAYKRAHNIVDPELQAKSLIGKQEGADRALINLEARYRIVSMIKDFVSDPANAHAFIPFSADSTAASGAIQIYNQLVMQRMKLENSAINDNPSLKQLDEQIEVMRRNVVNGVDNTLRALRVQIDKTSGVRAASSGSMSQFPTEERQARSLYRQQGIQNEIYTFLLEKREENALILAATSPKGKIVDEAYAKSEPIEPKPAFVFFIALVAALLLPIIALALRNLFKTRFTSQDELESLTGIPVIGHLQHNRHDRPLVVEEGSNNTSAELFRYVRNNVQFMLPNSDDKVILVTSCVSGEGKSFVSLNLAATFALLGKRVALVGMDIRSPQLAQMLQLKEAPGVTGYLSQPEQQLADVMQHVSQINGLDVAVGGAIPPNPSELLMNNRMEQLMSDLKERYDVIVLDSAPIAMVSDTFSLARFAHMTLAVTRAGYSRRSMLKYLNRVVSEGRLPNVGLVLNDTKPNQDAGHGYGYGSHAD